MRENKNNVAEIRIMHLTIPFRLNLEHDGGYFILAGETFHLTFRKGDYIDKETITRQAEKLVYQRFVDLLKNRHNERQSVIQEIRELI